MQQQCTKLLGSLCALLHLKGIWSRVPAAEEDNTQPSLYIMQKTSGALCNKNTPSPWCIFRFNGHWVTTTRSHHTCLLCFKYIFVLLWKQFYVLRSLANTLKYNLCSSKQFLKRFAQDILHYKNKAPAMRNTCLTQYSCQASVLSICSTFWCKWPTRGGTSRRWGCRSEWNGSSVFEVSQVMGTLSSVVIGQVNDVAPNALVVHYL